MHHVEPEEHLQPSTVPVGRAMSRTRHANKKQFSQGHAIHREVLGMFRFPSWLAAFCSPLLQFSYFHAGPRARVLHMSSELREMGVRLKAKKMKSTLSLFLWSFAHSENPNPGRDCFKVIGADVAPAVI